MAKFRKKSVVIEAVQTKERVVLEGDMVAEPGDWIITGAKGEKYPCKPDSFKATYEPVEGEAKPYLHKYFGAGEFEEKLNEMFECGYYLKKVLICGDGWYSCLLELREH